MREVLFRGKRVDNGEWVEGYLSPFTGLDYDTKERWSIRWYILGCAEVIPETVGQFTGMTDKNGKQVFDGDILADHRGGNATVAWDGDNARWIGCDSDGWFGCAADEFSYREVIGNIHDNPELTAEVTE